MVWMLMGGLAAAADGPAWSGDLALSYGRNWGQELMVAGLVGEVKRNVHPQLAVGVRTGGQLGVSVSTSGSSAAAKAFTGAPLLLKGEGFLGAGSKRPFAGLATGVTFANGAGAVAGVDDSTVGAAAYAVKGPIFTVMPEIGVDLGKLRLSLAHALLLGSAKAAAASVDAGGTVEVSDQVPGLSGTTLQVGLHWGGPKA